MANIDRGRLAWPTDLLVDVVAQTIVTFKSLLLPNNFKEFVASPNQPAVLMQLALKRYKKVVGLSGLCSACNTPLTNLVKDSVRIVSNIALNNYTKQLGDCRSRSETLRKLSTLVK